MTYIVPAPLSPGDVIGVVSPSGEARQDRVQPGLDYLYNQGYKIRLGKHVFDRRGYLAGTDRDRAKDLMDMFLDPEVKAIIAVRGGYGSTRLLPHLKFRALSKYPKILQGFSDVTALLHAFQQRCGFETYHGPMVQDGFDTEGFAWREFLACHTGNRGERTFSGMKYHFRWLVQGQAQGPLLGGCLSVLSSMAGSKYAPNFEDSIFFFEDTGEEPYRIDRMLMHLRLSSGLNKVAGVIVGRLHRCEAEEPQRSLTMTEILHDHFGKRGIPVLLDFPTGHGIPQVTLPMGRTVKLDSSTTSVTVLGA